MKIEIEITDEQMQFLELIQHQDAAEDNSQAIQWCIDSCMKIEELYKIDACYVAHHNIVLDTLLNPEGEGLTDYNIKYYDDDKLIQVKAKEFTQAGIQATAYKLLKDGVGWGIEWIESDRTHNRVPFNVD